MGKKSLFLAVYAHVSIRPFLCSEIVKVTYVVRVDQDHLTHCYSDLKIGIELDDDEGLLKTYDKMMKRREASGWD